MGKMKKLKARLKTKKRLKIRRRHPQCLSPTPNYTEDIHENLKIFDKLFSEFEFSYVSCMVHVKTVKGSGTLKIVSLNVKTWQSTRSNRMWSACSPTPCRGRSTTRWSHRTWLTSTTQGESKKDDSQAFTIFFCSLMFAIPRLAIVCGLVIFPTGPLNVERDTADFPELFRWDSSPPLHNFCLKLENLDCRPFKNLLRKIRDLLLTLTPGELFVLERLLCQLEEPTDLEKKLQVALAGIWYLSWLLKQHIF